MNEPKKSPVKPKLLSRSALVYLREFSDSTSLHGVKYVGERGRHPLERLCWVVAIVACAVFCGLEIQKIWTRWQRSPVIITFAQRPANVARIPFPAVTICSETRVRRTILDVGDQLNIMREQLAGQRSFHSIEHQLRVEAASMQCIDKLAHYSPLLPSNFTPNSTHHQVLLNEISPRMEDIFLKCTFEGNDMNCSNVFRPILTMYGLCYTFNSQEDYELYQPRAEEKQRKHNSTWSLETGYPKHTKHHSLDFPRKSGVYVGPLSGLRVRLKSHKRDVQDTCSAGPAETYRVLLHLPAEFPPTFDGNFFHVSPGSMSMVALRPEMMRTAPELRTPSYSPHVRGCNYPEDYRLNMFQTYTQLNCELECENNIYRQYCGCQLFFYPLEKDANITHCPVNKTRNCGESFDEAMKQMHEGVEHLLDSDDQAAPCDCLPGCRQIKYHYHHSASPYSPPPLSHHANESDVFTYSKLVVFFEEATLLTLKRKELYGVTDFIASCGGLLGLFTGFSVITFAELLYFATLRLFCCMRHAHPINSVVASNNGPGIH